MKAHMDRVIFDLCGGSGSWSAPYHEAGYNVLIVDPYAVRTPTGPDVFLGTVEEFLRVQWYSTHADASHGILMAPPCTEFAVAGAWTWAHKPPEKLANAIATVRVCLAIKDKYRPKWWALENPIGRLQQFVPELGPPKLTFDPYEYGDPYTKRTQVFGNFKPRLPRVNWALPTQGSKMAGKVRDPRERAITPPGFARAFFLANP